MIRHSLYHLIQMFKQSDDGDYQSDDGDYQSDDGDYQSDDYIPFP